MARNSAQKARLLGLFAIDSEFGPIDYHPQDNKVNAMFFAFSTAESLSCFEAREHSANIVSIVLFRRDIVHYAVGGSLDEIRLRRVHDALRSVGGLRCLLPSRFNFNSLVAQ